MSTALSNELQKVLNLLKDGDWDGIERAFKKFNVPNSPLVSLLEHLNDRKHLIALRRCMVTVNSGDFEHIKYEFCKIAEHNPLLILSRKDKKFMKEYKAKYLVP